MNYTIRKGISERDPTNNIVVVYLKSTVNYYVLPSVTTKNNLLPYRILLLLDLYRLNIPYQFIEEFETSLQFLTSLTSKVTYEVILEGRV